MDLAGYLTVRISGSSKALWALDSWNVGGRAVPQGKHEGGEAHARRLEGRFQPR